MDDKEIARKYLITSLTIKNLELDLQYIKNGQFKIKGPLNGNVEEVPFMSTS